MPRLLRIPKSGRSVIGGCRKTGFRTIEEQKAFLLSPNQAGYEPYWDCRKFRGRFRVSGTVLTQRKRHTRKQWEQALMLARARASETTPLISSELL